VSNCSIFDCISASFGSVKDNSLHPLLYCIIFVAVSVFDFHKSSNNFLFKSFFSVFKEVFIFWAMVVSLNLVRKSSSSSNQNKEDRIFF